MRPATKSLALKPSSFEEEGLGRAARQRQWKTLTRAPTNEQTFFHVPTHLFSPQAAAVLDRGPSCGEADSKGATSEDTRHTWQATRIR